MPLDKVKGNDFSKRKGDINRNGRPRKMFTTFNQALKEEGIKPLTKAQMMEAFTMIFNTDKATLKKWLKDKDTPIAISIVLEQLTDRHKRAKAFKEYMEWTFGRAANDITINAQQSVSINELWKLSDGSKGK